jgi:hypothetical protein
MSLQSSVENCPQVLPTDTIVVVKGKSIKNSDPHKYFADLTQQIADVNKNLIELNANNDDLITDINLNRGKLREVGINQREFDRSKDELTRQNARLKYHYDNLKQMLVSPAGLTHFDAYMNGVATTITDEDRQNIKNEIKDMKMSMKDISIQINEQKSQKLLLEPSRKEFYNINKILSASLRKEIAIQTPIRNTLYKLEKKSDNMLDYFRKMHLTTCTKDFVHTEKSNNKCAVLKAKNFNLKLFDRLPIHMLRYISEFLPFEIRTDMLETTYSPYQMRRIWSANTDGEIVISRMFNSLSNKHGKILKHLMTMPIVKTICLASPAIYRVKSGVAVNKMKFRCLMHSMKTENPEIAYNLIRKISILFLQSNRLPPVVA